MESWKPSREAIQALVELLPAMEREPESDWIDERLDDGTLVMPMLLPDDAESQFMELAYRYEWVHDFDWGKWQERCGEYVEQPDLLAEAPVATIRKLITTHVRKERFCEGHFRHMRECGHLAAILRRLQALLADATESAGIDPGSLPPPDRSDQTVRTERADSDECLDYGHGDGRLRDGRPYRLESWSQYGLLMLTVFVPLRGLEDATQEELIDLLVAEGIVEFLTEERQASVMKFTDASGKELWSINIVIGNDDGLIARHG